MNSLDNQAAVSPRKDEDVKRNREHSKELKENILCNLLDQWLANFPCKKPNNKYFRLCGPHTVSIEYCPLVVLLTTL